MFDPTDFEGSILLYQIARGFSIPETVDHGGGGRDALLSPILKGCCQKVQLPWSMGIPSFLFLDVEPFFGISTRRAALKR